MRRLRDSITRGDVTLFVILLIAALLAIPMSVMAAGENDGTATISGPYGETVVDLAEPAVYVIEGRSGEVVFEVADSELVCASSSCEEQVCVKLHAVTRSRPVVCAPNGVSATMSYATSEERAEGELDAVSR
jgi:hypothetical protein